MGGCCEKLFGGARRDLDEITPILKTDGPEVPEQQPPRQPPPPTAPAPAPAPALSPRPRPSPTLPSSAEVAPVQPSKAAAPVVAPKDPCAACGTELAPGQRLVSVDGKRLHSACFACAQCGQALAGSYVPLQGRYLCDRCAQREQELAGPACFKCAKPISGGRMLVLDKPYHKDCFVCAKCAKPLQGSFVPLNDLPHCQDCGNPPEPKPHRPAPAASSGSLRGPAASLRAESGHQRSLSGAPAAGGSGSSSGSGSVRGLQPGGSGHQRSLSGSDMGLSEYLRALTTQRGVGFANFTKDWQDGRAICAVAAALVPGFEFEALPFEAGQAQANIKRGLEALERAGVPPLVDAQDFGVERLSMMTYLAEVHKRLGGGKVGLWGK